VFFAAISLTYSRLGAGTLRAPDRASRRSPNNDYGNRDKNGSSLQSKGKEMCSKGTARGNTLDAQPRKHETFSPGIEISSLMKQV
jgi:hypothetical protein